MKRTACAVGFVGGAPSLEDRAASLPDMSLDGGSEEEFQSYWDWNSRNTRVLKDGWIERMAHPQVNCQAYWYSHSTDETTFEQPAVCEPGPSLVPADLTSDFSQEGPVWTFTAPELRPSCIKSWVCSTFLPSFLAQESYHEGGACQ